LAAADLSAPNLSDSNRIKSNSATLKHAIKKEKEVCCSERVREGRKDKSFAAGLRTTHERKHRKRKKTDYSYFCFEKFDSCLVREHMGNETQPHLHEDQEKPKCCYLFLKDRTLVTSPTVFRIPYFKLTKHFLKNRSALSCLFGGCGSRLLNRTRQMVKNLKRAALKNYHAVKLKGSQHT
jgi:hypothetical protein